MSINDASTRGRTTELLAGVANDAAVQCRRPDEILVAVTQNAAVAANVTELSCATSEISAALRAGSTQSIESVHASLGKLESVREGATDSNSGSRTSRRTSSVSRNSRAASGRPPSDEPSLSQCGDRSRARRRPRPRFAVVAGEIRKLADKAARAAKDVAQTARAVSASTQNTRAGVGEAAKTIADVAQDGDRIRAELQEMQTLIGGADDRTISIAAVAEQQSTALQLVLTIVTETKREAGQGAARAAKLRDTKAGDLNRDATTILGRYRSGAVVDRMYDAAVAAAVDVEAALRRACGPHGSG